LNHASLKKHAELNISLASCRGIAPQSHKSAEWNGPAFRFHSTFLCCSDVLLTFSIFLWQMTRSPVSFLPERTLWLSLIADDVSECFSWCPWGRIRRALCHRVQTGLGAHPVS